MADYRKEIDSLQLRLEELSRKQEFFSTEIATLKLKINSLLDLVKAEADAERIVHEEVKPAPVIEIVEKPAPAIEKPVVPEVPVERPPVQQPRTQPQVRKPEPVAPVNSSSALEKYIGQNLIPVIGIIITVIGVGIGAKYAIDHQLITPLTRILLGYLMGAGLLFFAIRLKKKYHEFSAVLLSGSMAIFYFITFFAYSFYGLIPLSATFLLMVVITAATVYSAIRYNLQVIAHIGLVGAYAVPFLVSNGSGRIGIFFSYMTVINIGILVVSFLRDWRPLYYVAVGLTWIIFSAWFSTKYNEQYFTLALVFLLIFFMIFYAANLAHKLIKKEVFDEIDGLMILLNSLVFYGLGMAILAEQLWSIKYLSWFTLFNAGIHFGISGLLHMRKPEDRKLFFLSLALGITFVTIFIPIKAGGNWITLFWICEGGFLFWIGRTQAAKIFEYFSHPIMLLAFLTLLGNYMSHDDLKPFWNVNLLTSMLFMGVLISVYILSKNEKYPPAYEKELGLLYLTNNMVYVLIIVILYFAVQHEISNFWDEKYYRTWDPVLKAFKTICTALYALLLVSAMAFLRRKTKNGEEFNIIFFIASIFVIVFFLTMGLYQINYLHLKYLNARPDSVFYRGAWLVGIRYISFAIVALAVFQVIKFVKNQMPGKTMVVFSEYLLHTVIVWCASAELVNWVHSVNSAQAYKLVLSIFAGLYALFLIVLGIWKQKSYLRIGAISLFGITLLKLFFYDISKMDTIFKTVIFISLGVLLLIIAFLYNKYKNRMFD